MKKVGGGREEMAKLPNPGLIEAAPISAMVGAHVLLEAPQREHANGG